MKTTLNRVLCFCLMLIVALLPVMASANYGYFYVKTGNGLSLNVRSSARKVAKNSPDNNVVAEIPYRSYVLVYEYTSNKTWAYIEAENPKGSGTVKGYVQASYLVRNDPGPYRKSSGGETETQSDVTFEDINKAAKALKILDEPYYTVIKTKKASNYVHLRWFPSTAAAYSAAYLCDEPIEVLAQSKSWAQVRIIEDGKVGFIVRSCVADPD